MAKNTCKPNQWKIYGRQLKKGATANFKKGDVKPGDILIEEQKSALTMGPKTNIQPLPARTVGANEDPLNEFGMPISADLAVKLISLAFDKSQDLQKSLFSMADNKILDNEQAGFINDVISLNYGITFDKTVTLKILGQPNCEGLRCYLCKRPDSYKAPFTGEESHLSLVLVGVDANGYDLNYIPDKSIVSPIATKSLPVEYGYPPTGKTMDFKSEDEHYVLLNYAKQLKKIAEH